MKHDNEPQESVQPSSINACDWEFNEHRFKKDEPFENPGIAPEIIDLAVRDGLVRPA